MVGIEGLKNLGITEPIGKEEILSLTVKNYSSGPDPDEGRPGDVWVFGKVVNGKKAYIKLKLFTVNGQQHARCISFHKEEYPLRFPFR